VRISEPQPKLSKEFAKPIWDIPNALLLSNPCGVRINIKNTSFDFLMYHGYSFDYYGDVVESIRSSGRNISDRVDLIMKFLLQRRHLGPTHESTLHIPDANKDPLVIEHPPDFFLSGHIHKAAIGTYRGISTVCTSCFQSKTGFQEKVGHEPEPCQVPIISLKDRTIKMLNFAQ
jgi:DNA polymerase II small subunit